MPTEPVRLYSEQEEDPECSYALPELTTQAGKLKRPIRVLVEAKAKAVPAVHFSNKEMAANDRKLRRDDYIDALNPTYMYPELGEPYSDRYLNHPKPPPGRWLTTKYPDIEDDFIRLQQIAVAPDRVGAFQPAVTFKHGQAVHVPEPVGHALV